MMWTLWMMMSIIEAYVSQSAAAVDHDDIKVRPTSAAQLLYDLTLRLYRLWPIVIGAPIHSSLTHTID